MPRRATRAYVQRGAHQSASVGRPQDTPVQRSSSAPGHSALPFPLALSAASPPARRWPRRGAPDAGGAPSARRRQMQVRAARRTTGTPCLHDIFAGGATTKRRTHAGVARPSPAFPGSRERRSHEWWSSVLPLWRWHPAQTGHGPTRTTRHGVAGVSGGGAASSTLPGVSIPLPRPCSEPVDLAMSPVTREAQYGLLERLFDGIPAARASALSLHVLGSPRRAPPAFLRRIAAFPVPRSFTLVSLRGERVPTRSTKTPQLLEFPSLAPAPGVHWSVLSSKELRLRSVPPARAALVASFRSA